MDVTASVSYVAAGLPFIYVVLLEAGVVGHALTAVKKGRRVVAAVVLYLILAHAAMVFGMFDPVQFGWQSNGHMMHDMSSMSGNHAMSHEMPGMTAGHHCGGMSSDDLTDMMLPEGHSVPESYHKIMPDGRLMKNGPMMPDMPMHRH